MHQNYFIYDFGKSKSSARIEGNKPQSEVVGNANFIIYTFLDYFLIVPYKLFFNHITSVLFRFSPTNRGVV